MFEFLSSSYPKYFSGSKAYLFLKSINYPVFKERPLQILNYFNDALVVFLLELYSRSSRSRRQYPRKIYLADNGLIAGMNGNVDTGRGMENLIFIELCRRSEGREVDFVIVKGGRVLELIIVSFIRSREDVMEKETVGLEKTSRELKCNHKIIITWDYGENGKIRYISLWEWLLEK